MPLIPTLLYYCSLAAHSSPHVLKWSRIHSTSVRAPHCLRAQQCMRKPQHPCTPQVLLQQMLLRVPQRHLHPDACAHHKIRLHRDAWRTRTTHGQARAQLPQRHDAVKLRIGMDLQPLRPLRALVRHPQWQTKINTRRASRENSRRKGCEKNSIARDLYTTTLHCERAALTRLLSECAAAGGSPGDRRR